MKPLYVPLLPTASFAACCALVKKANERKRRVCGHIFGELIEVNPGEDPHNVFCDAGWYPCNIPACIARKKSQQMDASHGS